ncbi:LysR family transcriptional regulator [Scleromatobacter humisilvae]|uniref:LysR family transcriptional regulator n=1 Tax=Scleromatobacter humisilvae TaxID=2897159 RepID=A0A9X1YFC9_9BURK|nr:LysR family transcriptional regulator [Scleromatobacter humisilvae]MCK9685364.1 LysR family transcriptional regulator [Scleromatobacter humisilvae]
MSERLNGVSAFVEVVEAGSFADAAVRLCVTRSAVGKTIARLEQRLGVRLFHRTTRRQSLTDDGQLYYERCVRALAELDAAEDAIDNGRREPTGRLRVSVPVLFGRYCVAPILRGLAREHPRLEIEISFTDRVADLIGESFDMAVRVGVLPDSLNLVARRLGIQRMAICASPAYLERNGQPTSTAELASHTSVVYGRGGSAPPWRVREHDGSVHESHMAGQLRFDDMQAIADAAVAGAGLAWLPCWLIAKHVAAGELMLVMDSERVVATEIHAVWPQTIRLASKTRLAIDALVSEIPAMLAQPQSDAMPASA